MDISAERADSVDKAADINYLSLNSYKADGTVMQKSAAEMSIPPAAPVRKITLRH